MPGAEKPDDLPLLRRDGFAEEADKAMLVCSILLDRVVESPWLVPVSVAGRY